MLAHLGCTSVIDKLILFHLLAHSHKSVQTESNWICVCIIPVFEVLENLGGKIQFLFSAFREEFVLLCDIKTALQILFFKKKKEICF